MIKGSIQKKQILIIFFGILLGITTACAKQPETAHAVTTEYVNDSAYSQSEETITPDELLQMDSIPTSETVSPLNPEEADDLIETSEPAEDVESYETTEPNEDENDIEIEMFQPISFPYALEGQRLLIENVFQFDGINPDCNNETGDEFAAITVKNQSEDYLSYAEITMVTDEGNKLCFMVNDLPAGKTAMVFSDDNSPVQIDTVYGDVSCKVEYLEEDSMSEDMISVSVEGTQIILKNETNEEIETITLYCHSILDDQYFGGIAYTYSVNNIPANGTAEVDAVDCFLGFAEVVRIAVNDQ